MMISNDKLTSAVRQTGIVPLFTPVDAEEAYHVIRAAYKAGIRAFEMTNRKAHAYEVFCEIIRKRNEWPDLLIGVGTVLDGNTTSRFIDAGADFIISPILSADMAAVCNERSVPWIPGCGTLTEIVSGQKMGAEIIKIFPGSSLGPHFLSAILPVVPDLKLMVTGGVEPTESSLKSWFSAGAFCVGLGSRLISSDLLKTRNWESIEKSMSEAVTLAKQFL